MRRCPAFGKRSLFIRSIHIQVGKYHVDDQRIFNAGLGIDAIGGTAIGRLIDCVAESGTVVNYGLLSGEPYQINASNFVFRDIKLVGFWLAKVMRGMRFDEIQAMYQKLTSRLLDGTIHVEIEASYPLEKISDAMAHAKREARGGKVQLRPNG